MNEGIEVAETAPQQTIHPQKSDFSHAQFEREKTERIKALAQALAAVANVEGTSYGGGVREQIANQLNSVCCEQFFVKYI